MITRFCPNSLVVALKAGLVWRGILSSVPVPDSVVDDHDVDADVILPDAVMVIVFVPSSV